MGDCNEFRRIEVDGMLLARRTPASEGQIMQARTASSILVSGLGIELLLASPVLGAQEEVTTERIRDAFGEAHTAVQESLRVQLDASLELRFVDSAEIAERIAAENLPAIERRQPDPAKAELEARALGDSIAPIILAKYAWSSRAVLVALDTWNTQTRSLDRSELASDEALRAVLVHELAHAVADAEHGLTALVAKIDSLDASAGVNAILEGHAQHLARRVCEARGWTPGFEVFTQSIGALPEATDLDQATLMLLRVASATTRTAYCEGERFIAALESAGGEEAIARAFRDPPRDGETVFHPEWFLDPTKRPKSVYDLDAGIELFAQRFPEQTWLSQKFSLQPAQIEAALELLPAETTKRIADSLRASRVIIVQPKADPTAKLASAAVLEFDADESAVFYVESARSLAGIKDEKMKTGTVRINSSSLSELDTEAVYGFLQKKDMNNGSLEFEVTGMDAARGRLVVETVFSAEAIDDREHEALVLAILDAVRKEPEEER